MRTGGNRWLSLVADNGVGVPHGFDFRLNGNLGIQTIFALGEGQLRGTIDFDSRQGVTCRLRFSDTFTARV